MGVSNNEVRIEGRITAKPEIKYTQSEKAYVRFSLAVPREWTDRDEADFVPVVAWNGTAKAVAEHVVKGQVLVVAGRLQSRTYETEDGQKRSVLEVIAREVKFGRKPKAAQPQPKAQAAPEAVPA